MPAIKNSLDFEILIRKLSTEFINLSIDEIDKKIELAFELIAESLSIERIALLQFSDDNEKLYLTHSFAQDPQNNAPTFIVSDSLPWFSGSIKKGKILRIATLDDIPEEAQPERQYAAKQSLKSFLTIPLTISSSVIGGISYSTLSYERAWSDEVVQRVTLVNEIFTNAIDRFRKEKVLADANRSLFQRSKVDETLLDISASFIDASVENIDGKMNESLQMIGELLELDRCSIGYLSEDKQELLVTYVWNKVKIQSTRQSYLLSDFPWLLSPFTTGEQLLWHYSNGMPDCSDSELELLTNTGMKCFAGIPVAVDNKLVCCLGFSRITCDDDWNLQIIDQFPLIASLFGQLMQRRKSDIVIHNAFLKINDLKNELEQENISLHNRLRQLTNEAEIIGESDALQACLLDAEHVASENTTVLILGETGTGKELLAQTIHNMSPRKDNSMVKVNCAALPANLIESELFGREKGAYTGAMARHQGRFELADGSTIFLDEIGDLPLELQSKLLRVLQEGKFERLGSTKTITVDVRVVAATNIDLYSALEKGTFRKDLFYRLNVFPITLPPLSERREDIPLLVWSFVEHFNAVMGKSVKNIPEAELKRLQHADWSGNVRELKNTIERSMIISKGSELTVRHERRQDAVTTENSDDVVSLAEVERRHILKALQATYWRVSGEMGAAKILNIKPTTLEARMKKLGIVRPPK